ncbi:MAG: hypothetical protein KKA16_04110 [Alphaproteobacteria bacterium]|nr:hypothetical protein [Alphaproteobacteria bacterium]MBU2378365.1 hypothetical protein [Alphaproteobacteria bacterium]
MTPRPAPLAAPLIALALLTGPAAAQVAVPARPPVSPAAEPLQFYVFSFTETPVEEAAQDIVVGALAYDLTVDPAARGIVNFRADGWSTGEALLKDFGGALMDQDIALMRTGPGAYALIPRANMPMLMARGAVLMAPPEPTLARPPSAPAAAVRTAVYGRDRWWDGAFSALLIFFAGAVAGGAALLGGQAVYRRAEAQGRIAAPLLRLTDQRRRLEHPVQDLEVDPDLVIPRFDDAPPR